MSIHVQDPLPFHRDLAMEYRMRRARLLTPARLPAPAGMVFARPSTAAVRAPLGQIKLNPPHRPYGGPWGAPRIVVTGGTGFPLQATQDALRWLNACPERVTVHLVARAFAAVTCFGLEDICGQSRTHHLVRARQCAMILARRIVSGPGGSPSLPLIGGVFGGRDHTTVVNAEHRVGALIDRAIAEARGGT